MYYYGYFRSIDTSEDPQGQLYKVVIITEWDGVNNPYPYYVPDGHTVSIPDLSKHIELTLSAHPFRVTYPNHENPVEGGCRCSTAEVSFCMSQFVQGFMSSNDKKTLVALLKRKNSVVLAGSSYGDPDRSYRLYKTGFRDTGSNTYLFNDFLPEQVDAYLYTTEWIGIASPESYSMGYNHIFDTFTLNAQDIISTLKYKKFAYKGSEPDMESMYHWLFRQLYTCGVIKHIYLTDTVHLPSSSGNSYHANMMLDTFFQEQNFQEEVNLTDDDEDNEELIRDSFEDSKNTLETMMKYLNMQLIQWGDSVFITTPSAVTRGYSNYKSFNQRDSSGYCKLVTLNTSAARNFYAGNDHNFLIQTHLDQDSFTSENTRISTDNVYSRAKVVCNEYIPKNIIADLNDDRLMGEKWPANVTSKERWNRKTAGGWQATSKDYWCFWETWRWYPQNDDIRCYRYKEIVHTSDYWSDTPISSSTTNEHYQLYLNNYNSSMVLDDGGIKHVGYNGATPDNFNPTRTVLFVMPYRDYHDSRTARGYDNKGNFALPMFYIRSKKALFHAGDYLNIGGVWKFYRSAWVGTSYTPDDAYGEAGSGDSGAGGTTCTHRYIWAKVKFGQYWLSSNSELNYSWSTTEQWCKLWLYCQPSDERSYGKSFEFHSRERNVKGTCIPLPILAGKSWFTNVEITIDKPLGVSDYVATCATWQNPSIGVVTQSFIDSMGLKDDDESDTKYRTNIISDAMEEYPELKIMHSSATNKKLSYACTVSHPNTSNFGQLVGNSIEYTNMGNVYNAATGLFCLPEKHIVTQISEQYRTPVLSLECDVHRNLIAPWAVVDWTFAPGRLMFPTGMEIDYEYETTNVKVTEIKTITERETIRQNTTRNFRRNNDNLVGDVPAAHSFELPDFEYINATNGSRERTVTVNENGHVIMETSEPVEGLIQVSPSISNDGFRLLVSIPNVITDANAQKDNNCHGKLYMDGSTPGGGGGGIDPIDPLPIDPVGPIDPNIEPVVLIRE